MVPISALDGASACPQPASGAHQDLLQVGAKVFCDSDPGNRWLFVVHFLHLKRFKTTTIREQHARQGQAARRMMLRLGASCKRSHIFWLTGRVMPVLACRCDTHSPLKRHRQAYSERKRAACGMPHTSSTDHADYVFLRNGFLNVVQRICKLLHASL